MAMTFVAVDVETANADRASICQIGLVKYRDGIAADEWVSYVDPQDCFSPINITIHGISESLIRGAPTFDELSDVLCSHLAGGVVVHHTSFDRVAISRAFERCGMPLPDIKWLDTAGVARRAWEWCSERGYGLSCVCERLGYEFRHHDALEDAKAAAHILLAATAETAMDVSDWLARVRQPIKKGPRNNSGKSTIKRQGCPEGPLSGEVIVFTGTLSICRSKAAERAAALGCDVGNSTTRSTTMLVVGAQDARLLGKEGKSSKHRKAEELIQKGQHIQILTEADFAALCGLYEEA